MTFKYPASATGRSLLSAANPAAARTAMEAAADLIVNLKSNSGSNLVLENKFNLNLNRFPLNQTQVCGYAYPPRDSRHKLFTVTGTATPDLTMFQSMVGLDVDPNIWEWVPIIYPHWFPADVSVAAGVANVITAINAWPGKFGFAGYSMGGIVLSNVLWELRYGSLQSRYNDLIGATMFGSPCREAGRTIPGGIDPGGAGIAPDNGLAWGRIRNTPAHWWEFANSFNTPGNLGEDPFTCNPTNSFGTDLTAIYLYFFGEWDGQDYTLQARLQQLFSNQAIAAIQDAVGSLASIFRGFGVGHMQYGWSRPLPGSDLSSVQLAIQHLNTVGQANPLTPQITGDDLGGRAWKWEQASGINCGFFMAPTENVDHYTVTPGETYMLECRIMPYAGNNTATGSIQLGATFIDTTERLSETESYEEFPLSGTDVIRGSWNFLEASVTVPPGYNQALFWIRTTANTVAGTKYWIDNPVVRESTFVSKLIADLTEAFTGGQQANNTKLSVAIEAMKRSYLELQNGVTALQVLRASADRLFSKGKMFRIEFDYFLTMDAADFTVTYSGPGTSTIGIKSGQAQWAITSNSDRDAKIIFNSPTDTDFQILRGTMASPPQKGGNSGSPKFSAIARVSEDGLDYIFARAYSTGLLSYRCEFGCSVNGVETVWQSNIPLKWSMDMAVVCGVGTNEREYQVWSGTTLVTSYTETLINTGDQNGAPTGGNYLSICGNTWKINKNGATAGTFTLTYMGSTTVSIAHNATAATVRTALNNLGKGTWTAAGIGNATSAGGPWYMQPPSSNSPTESLTFASSLSGGTTMTVTRSENKKWGSIAQIRGGSGGPFSSGKIASCIAADNKIPDVVGSTAFMYRTGTGSVNLTGGSDDTGLPSNFFTSIAYESLDVDANASDGTFTVSTSQPYTISGRIRLSANISALCRLNLQVYREGSWQLVQAGDTFYPNTGGAGQNLSGSWVQHLNAGEKVRLSTWCNGITTSTLTGESTGTETYFSIAGQSNS